METKQLQVHSHSWPHSHSTASVSCFSSCSFSRLHYSCYNPKYHTKPCYYLYSVFQNVPAVWCYVTDIISVHNIQKTGDAYYLTFSHWGGRFAIFQTLNSYVSGSYRQLYTLRYMWDRELFSLTVQWPTDWWICVWDMWTFECTCFLLTLFPEPGNEAWWGDCSVYPFQ